MRRRSANQAFRLSFRSGGAPCAGLPPGAPTCPLAVNLNTFPSGTLKTPYLLPVESWAWSEQLGARGSLRVDYVGTRGVHEPYQVQLNGYQTVCDGCFAPFAYNQPLDQRFGSVNEFRTDAGSNYTGLQTSVIEAIRRADAAGKLHLQPLPRRSIERRLAAVLQPGHFVAAARRTAPGIWQLRLRRAAQHLGVRHL